MVIQGEELQKRGYTSLEQALERIPGVSFVDTGLGRNIDLRGQGSKANVAVKVMVDGRAINVLDNSHGVTPLEAVSIDNIERIEIIPGGGSVLYGNGTRGGVINIITKKQKQDSFALGLNTNFYDRGKIGGNLNANIAKQITENFAISSNINGFNKKGFQDGVSERGYYINSKAYLDIGDSSNLVVGYDYFESRKTSSGYLTKEQIDNDPYQRGPNDVVSKINRPEISLDFTHTFNDKFELNANVFWQNQKIYYPKNEQQYSGVTAYQNESSFEDTLTGVELKGKYNYAENSYLIFGYDFEQHDADRTNYTYYSPFGPYTHRMTTFMDMKKKSHSLFVLDSHQFTEKFSISGGLRYEYADYKTDRDYTSVWNPPGGIGGNTADSHYTSALNNKDTNNYAFEITPHFQYSDTGAVYAKFERGFVSPTPAQFIGKRQAATGVNPYYINDLDSETFNTFEIGVSDYLWDFYGFSLTAFYTQSKDEIAYIGNPHALNGASGDINGHWSYTNLDETRRYGVELSLSQSFLLDRLVFRESLTYLDAEITKGVNDGLPIPFVSKVKTTAGVEYNFTKTLQGFVDLTYYSRARTQGFVDDSTGQMSKMDFMKDYVIADVGATYTLKNLQILAGVRNLFDDEYYTYRSKERNARTGAVTEKYSPGAGRNYYVEFKYKF